MIMRDVCACHNHNVNGIRAASRKGFLAWVASMQPDVLCLQEIKPMQICEALVLI